MGKDQSLTLKVCDDKGKAFGSLTIPVLELQHELNQWHEIPVTDKPSKLVNEKKEGQEKQPPVSLNLEKEKTENKPKVEESKAAKNIVNEEKSKEISVTQKPTPTSAPPKEVVPSKGIDKTYIIAGLGTLFFLLALLYTWFF